MNAHRSVNWSSIAPKRVPKEGRIESQCLSVTLVVHPSQMSIERVEKAAQRVRECRGPWAARHEIERRKRQHDASIAD